MTQNHIMLDLETLGVKPGCAILSIGAIPFDPNEPKIETIPFNSFHLGVEYKSCQEAGLFTDEATLNFWKKPEQAQAVERLKRLDKFSVYEATVKFCTWWAQVKGTYVWANGATFDPPILEHVLNLYKINTPWRFWNVRDTRTIYHGAFGPSFKLSPAHDALDDCFRQVQYVQEAAAKCNLLAW